MKLRSERRGVKSPFGREIRAERQALGGAGRRRAGSSVILKGVTTNQPSSWYMGVLRADELDAQLHSGKGRVYRTYLGANERSLVGLWKS
jgi:hypothetical protein